jgi:hypothetical protein
VRADPSLHRRSTAGFAACCPRVNSNVMQHKYPATPMRSARLGRSHLLLCLLAAMSPSGNAAPVVVSPGEYDLTAQTVLPHLEEALRYATTRTRRCLGEPDATSLFPLLKHQAFSGCSLVPGSEVNDGLRFTLQCRGGKRIGGLRGRYQLCLSCP